MRKHLCILRPNWDSRMNYRKLQSGKQLGIEKRIFKNGAFYWYSYAVQKADGHYVVYECEIAEDNMAMEEYEYENVTKYLSIEEVENNFPAKYDIHFSDIGPLKGQHIFNPYLYQDCMQNTEYLEKLNRADEQIKNGQVVTKTMDELLAMEKSLDEEMTHTYMRTCLRIMGDYFDVQEVTDVLEVKPSRVWNRGEPIRNSGKEHTETAWIYNTENVEGLDTDILINHIMELFYAKADKIAALKKKYDLYVSIDFMIAIKNEEPLAIYFESEFVKFAAKIGAELDIDTYVN